MNLKSQIELRGYGTSEGVEKEWDTRGRGKKSEDVTTTIAKKYVMFPSHRARDRALQILGEKPQSYYSMRRETGKGTYLLTQEQIDKIKGQHLVHFTLLRGPHDDLMKTWDSDMSGQAAGGQTDSSSFIGRKWKTQDIKYGHYLGEYDSPEEAEKAARARPYTRVVSWPEPTRTQQVRDIARKRIVKTNPDVD